MAVHRVRVPIPAVVGSDHGRATALAIASGLSPRMHASFGSVKRQDGTVVWEAHDWQADGTFVTMSIDENEGTVELYLDTRGLERPNEPPGWTWPLIVVVVGASLALGIWRASAVGGIAVGVVAFGVWIGLDVRRQITRQQARSFDADEWNARLIASVQNAVESSRL